MSNFSALKTAIQTAIKQNGNNEITGDILQDILLSIVSTLGDSAINTLEQGLQTESQTRGNDDAALSQAIENEATARGNQDTQLGNLITGIKNNIDNGYVYAGVATPSTTPVSGKVFYVAIQAGTYTNFGNTAVTHGINILKYNNSVWSKDVVIAIDDEPTAGSDNLVKSGSVFGFVTKKSTLGSITGINSHYLYAIKGHSYNIAISDTSIFLSGVKLGVFAKYATLPNEAEVIKFSDSVPSNVEFTLSSEAGTVEYIRLSVRLQEGETLIYQIDDITKSLDLDVKISNVQGNTFNDFRRLKSGLIIDNRSDLAQSLANYINDIEVEYINNIGSYNKSILFKPDGSPRKIVFRVYGQQYTETVTRAILYKENDSGTLASWLTIATGENNVFYGSANGFKVTLYTKGWSPAMIYPLTDVTEINFALFTNAVELKKIASGFGDISLPFTNTLYKIAAIERADNAQVVIALLGDSWTQHSWNTAQGQYMAAHTNYVQPFKKYLQSKYGNAGGGYYSFSCSHDGIAKMMSADPDDANDTRGGTITYQDQASGCKGIDAADALFGTSSWLILNVLTAHDKFVIHYYADSSAGKFTYTLDNGSPVLVDASSATGHQTITIDTTDSTHTLRFDITEGSVMLFGVDMQRTSSGVRVHKIGNKGATTGSYVIVDTSCWESILASLGIDSMTILLGVNDGASATITVQNNLEQIVDNIRTANEYVDISIVMPSNTETADMSNQAAYQRLAAVNKGTGFVSLIPLFGSSAKIVEKEMFYDDKHPTLNGGRMICDYLLRKLGLFYL